MYELVYVEGLAFLKYLIPLFDGELQMGILPARLHHGLEFASQPDTFPRRTLFVGSQKLAPACPNFCHLAGQ
jgi:hypothetical protein